MGKKVAVKKKESVSVSQVEAVRKNELTKLNASVPSVVEQANGMTVYTADEETKAYDMVVSMKGMLKQADARRMDITRPLDAAKKETIRLFKDITAPLEESVRILSGRIGAYRDEQERIVAEAEAKRLAEIAELERKQQVAREKAEARKTVKGKANAEAVVEELEDELEELEQVEYVPDVGVGTVAKIWTYEVEDEDQVPREFCSPDRGLLRAAVRDGVREIKGVRIFQERSIRSR